MKVKIQTNPGNNSRFQGGSTPNTGKGLIRIVTACFLFCFCIFFWGGGGYIHDTRDDTWCVSVSSVSTVSDPDYDDYFDNEFIQQHCKFHIFSFE